MAKVKKIVDGVVVEVDDNQFVKVIENGVVVEKPISETQLKKKEQTEPTQEAPLPGLGGVSEEPTPSPSVGQGVLRDVDQTQPRGEAFIQGASDLTRKDVSKTQVDNMSDKDILSNIYSKFPALKKLGEVTLKADTNFTRENTGVGDIEFFDREDPIVNYPGGYSAKHPKLGTYGILYNPKANNEQTIALDMLHGMPSADPKYKKLREEFGEAFLESKFGGDFKNSVEELKKEVGNDKFNEWYPNGEKDYFDRSYIDGVIRNLLFEGSAEDFKDARYWEKAREVYLSDDNISNKWEKIESYLTDGKGVQGLIQTNVREPQVDSEDTDMVDIKLSPKDAEYIVDGKKVDKTYFKDFLYERDNAQAIFDGRINISVKNDPEMEQFASRQVQSRETNDVWDSLKSGVITIGSSVLGAQQMVGDFLEDLTGIQPTGFAAMEKTAREAAIKDLQEKAKEAQESRFQADGDFIDLVSNGDFSEAGNMAVNTVVESGPLSLTALAATAATGNPMAGFAVLAPITTGMTYSEQMTTEDEAIRNLSDTEKYLRATAFGLAEAGSEAISGKILGRSFKLFGKGISDMVGRVASEFGEQAATDVAISSAKKTISEIMKNYGLSMAEEGAAEGLTQLTQNLTDAFIGVKDMSLEQVLEGVGNAIALGAASGGIMSTPGAAGQAISGVSKKVLDYKLSKKNGAEELTSEAKRMAEFNKIFADNLSDIESNIESRSEAVNATPNDMVSDTETVDLVEEKQKLEKEIEGKDPILTDGIKKRVGEINEELKKKAEAETVPAKQKGRLTKFSTPQDGIVGEVTYEDGTKKELTQEEYDELEKQEGLFDVETGTQPVEEAVPVEFESLETGGVKYYRTDENGNEIGSTEVTPVGNKIQIDNVFVKEGEKRKGVATSIIDKVISDYSGKTYDYIDENGNTVSEPYQIEVGTIVSEEGEAFIGSVRGKIDKFNEQQETVPAETTEVAPIETVSEKSLEEGKVEITDVKIGTHTSTNPIKIFKGLGGKKDLKGIRINAHKGAEGVFTAIDKNLAEDYARGEGISETVLPKGTTFEVVEIDGTGMTPGQYRDAEVKAINESKADVVKLITVDGKIKAGTKKQEQYVIKNEKLIEDAIQEQAAGQVPVQPEAKAGEKVEGEKPEAEPEKPTQKGKEEVLSKEDAKSEEKVKEFVEKQISDEKKQEEADKEIESKSEDELKEDVPDVLESISESEREKLDREAKFKGKSTVDYVIDYLKGKLKNVRQSIKNILKKIRANYKKAIITTAVVSSLAKGADVKVGETSIRDVFGDVSELVISKDKPSERESPIGLMALPLLFAGTGRKRRRKPLEDADADKVVTDWMEDVQKIYDAQKTKDKQAAVDEAATNLALSGRLNEIAPDQRLKVLEDIAKQTAAMDEKKSVSITSELQGLTLKEQFKQGFEEYVSAMKQKESDRKEKAKEAAQKKIDAVKERTAKAIERIKAKKAEEKEKYKGKIEDLEKESKANKEARKIFEAIVNDLAKDSGLSQISRNKASELLKSSRDVNAENLERLLEKAVRVIQYEYTRNIVKESDKKISDFKKNIEKNKFGTLTQSAKELAEITTQDIPLGLLPRFVDVIDGVSKKSPSAKDLDELAKFMSEFKNELDQQITDIQFFADVLNDFKTQKETEEIDDYLKQNGFTESQIEFFKNNRKAINAAYKSFYTKDGKELTTQEKIQKISEQMLDAKKVFREMKSNGEAKVELKKFKGQVQRAVDIADFFNNIQDSDIDYLTRTEANKLPVVFDNLNRGMVTSAEKRIMNRIKGGRGLDAFEKEDPSSPIKRAKTKDGIFRSFVSNASEFSKLERSFDPSVLKSSRELQEDIEKKVLDYADEAIKGLKGKPLYNQISKVIRPLVGSNTKVARVHETANELFKKMNGSPLHNTTLMSVYFRSREFDLNPNNPKIKNPLQYIDKTLKNTKLSEKKRAILKGIRNEYFRNGKPLTKEMLSFIKKSKGGPLIEFMDEVMSSTKEDVRFMSEVDESNPAEFFDGYQPRSTMDNGNKSIEDLLSDVSNSVGRPSLRTSAVQSRKSTVNALTFDAMDDFMRTAASIELQKNVAPALAEVNAFISEAKRSGNEDARIFAETLRGVLDSYVKNTLARDYKQKGLYGNLWSSMGRKVKKNTLAGISKATVESLIQLGKIHIDEDASNAFYKNASMKRNVSNQDILKALNSMNVARAGVLSSEMSRKRSFITDAVRRGDAGKVEELIYSASKTIPGRIVSGIDDFVGDINTALIKVPDLVGTVQVVIGSTAIRFKEITGKELDFDKLVNDPEYRAKYKAELDASIAYGDQIGTRMGGPGAMEQKSLQDIKGGDIRDLNRFVRSFSTNENEQILSSLTTLGVPTSNVVMGKRERGAEFENKKKAARGLASSLFGLGAYTSLRMAVGTLIMGLFGAILNGDDWDDEFDYWDWDVFKARVLGDTVWTALFGKFGIAESLIAQTLISYGIRQAYKASGQEEKGEKIADGMFYSTIDQNDRATKTFKMLGPEGKLAGSILETMYIASDAYEKENFDLLSDPRFKNNLFTIAKGAMNIPSSQDVGVGVRKAWYGRDENRKVRESFGKMGDSKIIDRSEKEVLRLYKKTRDRFVLPSIIKDKPRKIRERGVSFDVFIAPFSVRDLQKLKGDFIKREMDKLMTTKKYRNSSDSGKIELLKELYKDWNNASSIKSISKGKYESVDDFYLKNASMKPVPSK